MKHLPCIKQYVLV